MKCMKQSLERERESKREKEEGKSKREKEERECKRESWKARWNACVSSSAGDCYNTRITSFNAQYVPALETITTQECPLTVYGPALETITIEGKSGARGINDH